MKLRSVTTYHTRYGVRRTIRLYKAWKNMRCRVSGVIKDGSGFPSWKGLTIEWKTWPEFRAWALANGFSRLNNSLDRKRATEGYGPGNCRWIPATENSRLSMYNTHAKVRARQAA